VNRRMAGDHTYARIALIVALMAAGVFVVGGALLGSQPPADSRAAAALPQVIPVEAGTFQSASQALALKKAPEERNESRTLDRFYSRRAYPGAPPIIPHPLFEDRSFGGKSCLACHRDGGYVPPFKAYAPVTPHPDFANCRQCHLPQPEKELFRDSEWTRVSGPPINQEALRAGPPPIPHTLQLRENCVACHGGPGAVAEIRSPHPERANCRQCHVSSVDANAEFRRKTQ
jgi:nitrate reductase (cytochrome), electron transfer subunit